MPATWAFNVHLLRFPSRKFRTCGELVVFVGTPGPGVSGSDHLKVETCALGALGAAV